jgi:O-antigen/teichoic acid export membrane protein
MAKHYQTEIRTLPASFLRTVRSRVGTGVRRIGPTILANVTNQIVVVLSQIAVVPILIAAWGVAGFGTWIVLSAMPTYLGLSDFGLSISAKSDMAVRMARGDRKGAAHTLSSALAIAMISSGLFAAVYLAVSFAFDWVTTFSLHSITAYEAKTVLLFGLVQIFSYQAFLFSAAVIRATGHPAVEGYLSALGRGVEIFALTVVAWLGGSIVQAACAWACSRATLSSIIWVIAYLRIPELRPAISLISRDRMRALLTPSIAYAMFPVAQAVFIQGTTLAISSFAGPATAAIFNTTRVITRLGVLVANSINNSFVPHYSYAIGHGASVKEIIREHVVILFAAMAGYVLFIALFGETFVGIISRWQIPFERTLFVVLVVTACAEMAFGAVIALCSAVNQVGRLALTYAVLSVVTLGTSYVVGERVGIIGVATMLLAANSAMLVACLLRLCDGNSVQLGSHRDIGL